MPGVPIMARRVPAVVAGLVLAMTWPPIDAGSYGDDPVAWTLAMGRPALWAGCGEKTVRFFRCTVCTVCTVSLVYQVGRQGTTDETVAGRRPGRNESLACQEAVTMDHIRQ
jgi:hypothetical protein